jgi:hypothetical protein
LFSIHSSVHSTPAHQPGSGFRCGSGLCTGALKPLQRSLCCGRAQPKVALRAVAASHSPFRSCR